jgi:DNA-binding transcriptional LysR family regulator
LSPGAQRSGCASAASALRKPRWPARKVLPQWSSKGAVVHAVFPTRRGLLPSVRALLDFLADRFAALEEE